MATELIRKAVVTQFVTDMFAEFCGDHLHHFLTDDFRAHPWTALGISDGPEGMQQLLPLLRTVFSRAEVTIGTLNAYGDTVAAHYVVEAEISAEIASSRGIACKVQVPGFMIVRMHGERIAEYWCEDGPLSMLQRLGTIPWSLQSVL